MISFAISEEDAVFRDLILDRLELGDEERMSLSMDLTAAHANGCPIDFERLAGADPFNLYHDVFGLSRHICRDTGKIMNCFLPRFRKRAATGENL